MIISCAWRSRGRRGLRTGRGCRLMRRGSGLSCLIGWVSVPLFYLRGKGPELIHIYAGWFDSKHAAIEIPKDEYGVSLSLPPAADLRFPGPLISLEDVSYRYAPTSPLVLQNITLSIHFGDRIGIVGL